VDVLALLVEVTQSPEATAAVEASRIMTMLAIETSAREASAMWDNAALHVKDVEYPTTLVEREELERMLRAEAENVVALASTHEDVKSLI
jgi:hypothetical protein